MVSPRPSEEFSKLRELETYIRASFPEVAKRLLTQQPVGNNEQVIMKNIKELISESKNAYKEECQRATSCDIVIQKLRLLLDSRNAALSGFLKNGNLSDQKERRETRYSVVAKNGLLDSIHAFEKRLQVYMANEKAVSGKLTDSQFRLRMTENYFDSNDKEIKKVEQDISNGSKTQTLEWFRSITSSIRKERKEILNVVLETEKILDNRLAALDHRKYERITAEKLEEKENDSTKESPLCEKVRLCKSKLQKYVNYETNASQYFHADFAKQKRHLHDDMKGLRYDLETVEKHSARLEAERDKYKRLYDMERILKFSNDHDSPRYKAAEHDVTTNFHNQVNPTEDQLDSKQDLGKRSKRGQKMKKDEKNQKSSGCCVF